MTATGLSLDHTTSCLCIQINTAELEKHGRRYLEASQWFMDKVNQDFGQSLPKRQYKTVNRFFRSNENLTQGGFCAFSHNIDS
jgi:hypothetical protein